MLKVRLMGTKNDITWFGKILNNNSKIEVTEFSDLYPNKAEIEICGKKIPFRSSATIPRLYRAKFKRDIFKDLSKLEKTYVGTQKDGAEFQIDDLEIFENVAYIMAYHADNSIPSTIEEWLDQFDMFSIYEVLPQILELWGDNVATDIKAKKGLAEVSGR